MHTHYEGPATFVYASGQAGSTGTPTLRSATVVLDETSPGTFSVTCDLDLGDAEELRISLPNGRSLEGVITFKDGRTLTIVARP
ncbi:hypothetical protein thsps21_43960 [Pseudomonas sp. No.21]|uniref:hypothetical protein n=1 Tax=Pseudomonas TaxID=286 RepID=UPI000DA73702|nr:MULTISPECIES: hypothetical protein [Pseudomonas]MDW3716284.1 hypothetical protein [Pseudomonas sp. 2023EL-01195]PZE11809.1 hypothetical protein DMX10_19225 [Pseudomonas sp. 57B-090624]GJN46106.1 hypothetical protein TUM20249_20920 [Pseudomonas tohonis]